MHTGGWWGEGVRVNIGHPPPRQISKDLLIKMQLKLKIGVPPGNCSWKPWPTLGILAKFLDKPPLDFLPLCIFVYNTSLFEKNRIEPGFIFVGNETNAIGADVSFSCELFVFNFRPDCDLFQHWSRQRRLGTNVDLGGSTFQDRLLTRKIKLN
jgi:hypothetical protein